MLDVATGPFELSLDATTVDFGEVNIDASSGPRVVTLRNIGGEAITDLRAEEGLDFDGRAFSFTLEATRLEPGASTELSILFSPAQPGPVSSTILIQASDGETSRSYGIDLAGVGTRDDVAVMPISLVFDEVTVGTQRTESFEVRNESSAVRRVEFSFSAGVDVCGGDPVGEGDPVAFCMVPPSPGFAASRTLQLAPGQIESLQVRFAPPPVPGPFDGSIGYDCADANCGGEISLQGTTIMIGMPPGG